jgi:transposase InsO family protein
MNEVKTTGVGQQAPPRPPRGATRRQKKSASTSGPYPLELRLRAVKLHLEEGFTQRLVAEEMHLAKDTISEWVRRYQRSGQAGLESRTTRVPVLPSARTTAVQQEIVRLKTAHPQFGIRRIAQWLRRVLCLPASPETVRKTLHQHQLLPKAKPKHKRNPPKPRFFERATPMQLWQSDICTIRIGGQQAYLIGFMDDHSRYLVGLDLFRSQTSENVLDVYRRAAGEYGVPKEMLTDNGRQYATWRGKTRFQQELQKDNIHHIRSQPHHPMTLGKIERFWKTIWDEFLCRAQFATFEEARERIRLWVKFYNHKRPHQGLDGLCPADRFFRIQQPLRTAIEQGIQANILELALRGQPKPPFYMVGRMGEQSVVMKVEKGQFQMVLDGTAEQPVQEVSYNMEGKTNEHRGESEEGTEQPQCAGEVSGGPGDLDATPAAGGTLPGTGRAGEPAEQLAGAGAGRYAAGLDAAEPAVGGPGPVAASAAGEDVGTAREPAGVAAGPAGGEEAPAGGKAAGHGLMEGYADETDAHRSPQAHHPGAGGPVDGGGGEPPVGPLPQDLLREGTTFPPAGVDGGGTAGAGTPEHGAAPGGGTPPGGKPPVAPTVGGAGAANPDQGAVGAG